LIAVITAGYMQLKGPAPAAAKASRNAFAPPSVMARAETAPVESPLDAADDVAIWVHPLDLQQSVIIGTDKRRGLMVYDLEGRLLQSLDDGRLNNVDLRDGFKFGGRLVTLVAASNRSDRTIAFYFLNADTRRLSRAGSPVSTWLKDPYGLCMYAQPGGDHFVFVNDSADGHYRQWRIRAQGESLVAERVRDFQVGSRAEGCVADDETGSLYVAEENGGLWEYQAKAGSGRVRSRIDYVGGRNGLKADLEGVSIWRGHDGRGFIVQSNQGANSYAVYRREAGHAFVGLFRIAGDDAQEIDGVSETDGLDVVNQPLGALYPEGLLVVQDGRNLPVGQFQNFKLISWRDVAKVLGINEEG
jgi:3-phytase